MMSCREKLNVLGILMWPIALGALLGMIISHAIRHKKPDTYRVSAARFSILVQAANCDEAFSNAHERALAETRFKVETSFVCDKIEP